MEFDDPLVEVCDIGGRDVEAEGSEGCGVLGFDEGFKVRLEAQGGIASFVRGWGKEREPGEIEGFGNKVRFRNCGRFSDGRDTGLICQEEVPV